MRGLVHIIQFHVDPTIRPNLNGTEQVGGQFCCQRIQICKSLVLFYKFARTSLQKFQLLFCGRFIFICFFPPHLQSRLFVRILSPLHGTFHGVCLIENTALLRDLVLERLKVPDFLLQCVELHLALFLFHRPQVFFFHRQMGAHTDSLDHHLHNVVLIDLPLKAIHIRDGAGERQP